MLEDRDPLIRQIRALAVAIAARLLGRTEPVQIEIEATASGSVGLDVDVATRLSVPGLLSLLTTADGLDASRALLLGLLLAERPGQRARARALIAAALAARPALTSPEVRAVHDALGEVEPS